MKNLNINETSIKISTQENGDYICITDMARGVEGDAGEHIKNWLRSGSTLEFLGVWEKVHNSNFNLVEFHQIKSQYTRNTYIMSVKKWIKGTGAVGLQAKAGRYGGTYAHSDIALQFATWLSPEFYVYLIKEFQRLKQKEEEKAQEELQWNIRRTLAKVNYKIHAEAIKENLIPVRLIGNKLAGYTFASEADLLNLAVFGETSKMWRTKNPDKKGNMRDYASPEQLLVLANLEVLNAEFIKEGLASDERLVKLNEIAIHQLQILLREPLPKYIKGDTL